MRRILVANRGEIARRIFRTCRSMGISTVAVYSDPDRRALHVTDADIAVSLGGDTSRDSYLDYEKLLAAAAATGADGVHPGYGFLAENADFAERCIASGLTWIGPSPSAIRAMALKIEAKSLAASAGVPLLPGATIVDDDHDAWTTSAQSVGFPLMVKASAGGGGKGMRLVEHVDQLVESVQAARREAASSFGDDTVFLERYLAAPRHVEIQVVADAQGSVLHLFDRDCSLQRRHQKVVEEAPAPGLPAELRQQMELAAVRLTRSIGYEGVGTLEFLVADGEFFFLEMNTRLQVEHPVTEEITGLDLVRLQIDIAAGHALPLAQSEVRKQGHAVEVRLYAEDPASDFLPSAGTINCFEPPQLPGIRWETGVGTGSEVSSHYDPMLAKVVAHADTRQEAVSKLARALRHLRLTGLPTNRSFLVATLESQDFADQQVSTAFYDQHPSLFRPIVPPEAVRHACVALAHFLRRQSQPESSLTGLVPPGWRSLPGVPQKWEFRVADGDSISVLLGPPSGGETAVFVDGEEFLCREIELGIDTADTEVDRVRRTFQVDSAAEVHWLSCDGWQIELEEMSRFGALSSDQTSGSSASPLPGRVVAIEVAIGDVVEEGQLLVVIEAMKMEHRITATYAGLVTALFVETGDQVDAHQPLVVVDAEGEETI